MKATAFGIEFSGEKDPAGVLTRYSDPQSATLIRKMLDLYIRRPEEFDLEPTADAQTTITIRDRLRVFGDGILPASILYADEVPLVVDILSVGAQAMAQADPWQNTELCLAAQELPPHTIGLLAFSLNEYGKDIAALNLTEAPEQ